MKSKWILFLPIITICISGIGFAHGTKTAQAAEKTVTVGVVGDSDRQLWEFVKKDAKKLYNLNIKLKVFTDYNQPNHALANKSIDLNSFQTINSFKIQNKEFKYQLKTIGKTYVTPISLYSLKYKTIKQLPDGATIVVPSDPSNEARAFDVIESAGLLNYDHNQNLPTAKDITQNPHNYIVKEVQADQEVGSLKSVEAAIIPTNYALDAKLGAKTILFTEPIDEKIKGYINLIVARKETDKTKIFQQVVKAYQSQATKQHMKELYGTAEIAAWDLK
ncbi:MAG: MetQ/NlpA family ABC transporter substrate-binding protein [Lactobacillaceae bacterium]|jgi:D-methionine transport system substrate-binding protein|nr:MetQ/NlpA family ABC transporter substrate-binding protein [Lactobacillaceae bacterium]